MQQILPDVWTWSVFSEEKKLDFNGHLIRGSAETVLVDPPSMEPGDLSGLAGEDRPFHILLTNKDHLRDAVRCRDELHAQLWIHEADADLLGVPADVTFGDGQDLPGGLRAIQVPDNKSPGEAALYMERHDGVLIVGDALIGDPAGRLRLLPEQKYADLSRTRRGLRVLLKPEYEVLLLGDGSSIREKAQSTVRRFLDAT